MKPEEQLKQEILSKYKSVRAFTTAIGIPYSTLDSVFKRGIVNAGISTMIKVFNALDLDIESIQDKELRHRSCSEKMPASNPESFLTKDEKALIEYYRSFNDEGKKKAYAYIEDLLGNPKYKKSN